MRFSIILLFVILSSSCTEKQPLSIKERYESTIHNFIPIEGSQAPNYWCTWGVQNFAGDSIIAKNATNGKNNLDILASQLNEENIFGDKEWASYFPKASKDLYILFDIGWNINQKIKISRDLWQLGTFDVADDKFPSCTGKPAQKLKTLNELCKNAGWKGAGLRLAAHPAVAGYSVDYQLEEIKRHYYNKMILCDDAGIEYLKIDDGFYSDHAEFRKMVTLVAKEVAPDLIVEHTVSMSPVNDFPSPMDTLICHKTGTFKEWGNGLVLEKSIKTLQFSDAFYIHDVTAQLSTATTLERVAQILTQFSEPTITEGLINCGDELYLAASLGCSMGISRHAKYYDFTDYNFDPYATKNRIDEVFRAIRWQRVANSFGVGKNAVYVDSKRLTDSWIFNKGETWADWLNGDTIIQKAPARISRGMPLPEVNIKGEPSYVTCSKYPNGAIALATLPRVLPDSGMFYPLVDVSIEAGDWSKPIAVFGKLKSLTINFEKLPKNAIVWAQDLASSRAIQITDLIDITENSIKLSGELISEVGLLAATPGDESFPGMMLVIKK